MSFSHLSSGVGEYLLLHSLEGLVGHVHPTRVEDVPGSVLAHKVSI